MPIPGKQTRAEYLAARLQGGGTKTKRGWRRRQRAYPGRSLEPEVWAAKEIRAPEHWMILPSTLEEEEQATMKPYRYLGKRPTWKSWEEVEVHCAD